MNQPTRAFRSIIFCLVIFISGSIFKVTEAKRGCSAFGHSCFGGHGKRSDSAIDLGTNNRELQTELNQQVSRMGQEEVVPPRSLYPHVPNDMFGNGDDIIPIRNGGFIESNEDNNNERFKFNLSPYMRHWLIAYRKAQENSNGYPFNNMI